VLFRSVLGFVVWGETPLAATPEAIADLQPAAGVRVEEINGWTVFRPDSGTASTALIFYPGGRVDYRAYAPLLRPIAAQGYLVVLVPMPLNLAVFGVEKAQEVIAAFPEIKHWAIGGHSLGGSMAAQFVINHPNEISGIAFWASYPGSSMAGLSIPVVSISGGNDGLATPAKIDAARGLLPAATRYVAIQGGIHAQFGSYGAQPGDGTAGLPASAQWDQTIQATVELLSQVGKAAVQ
jgi:hypothetical protein